MTFEEKTVAIVGSGAAGLTAAIAAARWSQHQDRRVSIRLFEKADRIGRSILATGNGRCNLSNAHLEVDRYHHADFVRKVLASRTLASFAHDDMDAVHAFFHNRGLVWRQEPDGRQFPLANKASVVLEVLRAAVEELGVEVACDHEIVALEAPGNHAMRFALRMKDGALEHADAVVMTCGGHNASPLRIEGQTFIETHPVLGPLSVAAHDRWFTRELDNIRVRAGVSLWHEVDLAGRGASSELESVHAESGELMFRKYGLSGICIFDLSRFAMKGDVVRIDFLQALGSDPTELLRVRYEDLARQTTRQLTYEDMLRGLVLPRVAEALLKRESIDPHDAFELASLSHLVQMLTCCELEIDEIADPNLCQVQRGGLDVSAFEAGSLASMSTPGLFAAGEVLDVDGPCGGYNLHWAWASGLVAGTAAAEYTSKLSL